MLDTIMLLYKIKMLLRYYSEYFKFYYKYDMKIPVSEVQKLSSLQSNMKIPFTILFTTYIHCDQGKLFFYFIYFIFFLLQWILSYIEMKQPWVYMCSPSRCPLSTHSLQVFPVQLHAMRYPVRLCCPVLCSVTSVVSDSL